VTGKTEILQRCKRLVGDPSAKPWAPDDLAGFFQCFRPMGSGLEAAFEGVEGREEILPRLLEIYQATADGWTRDDAHDMYLVVRRPPPISALRAEDLLRMYLHHVGAIARAVGNDELADLLAGPLPFEVVAGQAPWPPGADDPETLIHEVISDFMLSLSPQPSDALLLDEGLYTIACDYQIRHFVLWPLYRQCTEIRDPFRRYFDLWKHGAGYRFASDGTIRVYVPGLQGLPGQEGVE
jgi:hypothetical protein